MQQWARLVAARPMAVAVVVTLLTIVLGSGLHRLRFDVRPTTVVKADNQASRDLDTFRSRFGADDNDIVLMAEGDGLLTWQNLQAFRNLRSNIRKIADVETVASLFDVRRPGSNFLPLVPLERPENFDPEQLRGELLRHPVAASQLISSDGKMLLMWIRIGGDQLAVSKVVPITELTTVYARQYEQATGGSVYLVGHPAVRADVLEKLRHAMFVNFSLASSAVLLVAMLLFRSIVPVLVVIAAPVLGSVWVFGLLSWCGIAVGGLMTALPSLVLVIGLTDAVHLFLDGRRHLRAGSTRPQAVYRMLLRVGPACLLTSITTMIGFGSLTISRSEVVQVFGLWAAIGTTLVMIADLLVLPVLMQWIPTRQLVAGSSDQVVNASLLDRMVSPTLRFPRLTSAAAVVLCLLMIPPAFSQRPDIVWTEVVPDNSISTIAMRKADEKLGGGLVAYVMVTWPQELSFPDPSISAATEQVHQILADAPGFSAPFSVLNVLAAIDGQSDQQRYQLLSAMPASIQASLINQQERSLTVSVRVPNDGAAALNGRVDRLVARLQELANRLQGFQFTVTGTVVGAASNVNAIIIDLARSLAIAAALVFVVFAFAFRSLKVGLLSVIPNAFPLLVAAAALSLCGYPLQLTTAMTFALCLGLAVDDTTHVLVRYRAAMRRGSGSVVAIRRTIHDVGPALVVTTAILLVGFASMMSSPLPAVRLYAGLSGLTLITALVGDLMILPAMLVVGSSSGLQRGSTPG